MISAAGPVTNLLLCIPFGLCLIAGGYFSGAHTGLLTVIGIFGIQINAMIAAFNMLPISVLDGNKVLSWNIGAFLGLIIVAFGLLIGSFIYLV
jgi:Zn-dependent protease